MAQPAGWWAALLIVAVAGACGGSNDQQLYGNSKGGSGGLGGSSGTGAGGSAGAGVAGNSSGGNVDAQVDADGSSGGAPPDAAADTSGGSAGTGAEAGAGGVSGVGTGSCGDTVCSFEAGDTCCIEGTAKPRCANEQLGNPCGCGILCHTLVISCDGPEDCGSQTCCAERGITGGWNDVVCLDTCQNGITTTRRVVCHVGSSCPNGAACTQDAGLPTGYGTCSP